MAQDRKHSYVWDNKLCFNCLSVGHRTKDCKNSGRCHKCSKAQHTSLHGVAQTATTITTQASNSSQTSEASSDMAFVNASFSPLETTLANLPMENDYLCGLFLIQRHPFRSLLGKWLSNCN